jgi:hypothetical protein
VKRALLLAVVLLAGVTARADSVPGQGRRCSPSKTCPGKLQCVVRKGTRATCELVCSANADCPADQRCVKDSGSSVCHPITDEDTDYKRPPF